MQRKAQIDTFGALALVAFALNLAFNQVVIKVTNGGFGPVFLAGLRSLLAVLVLLAWMRLRGHRITLPGFSAPGGLLTGLLFAAEFICLFKALDITTVARASLIFYSMPVWLALLAHLLIPGESLTRAKILGLGLAMGGVALALVDRSAAETSIIGDLLALCAAFCWAGLAVALRRTRLQEIAPAQQLLWQLLVSAPVLLLCAPLFGPLLRDLDTLHLAGLAYQVIFVASFGFLFWFWLMSIYPASGVASFSFLSPVFSVLLGWLILGERMDVTIWTALALVTAGLVLINRAKPGKGASL